MMMKRYLFMVIVLIVVGCAPMPSAEPTPVIDFSWLTEPPPDITATPAHPGQQNYNAYCAHCHGRNGEGQLESTVANTLQLGMKTVPAHDATGHTWQHPDALLVQVILDGIDNPLNQYPMTGWGHVLDEQDALDIIDYMRQWWTPEQIAHQADVTQRWNSRHDDLRSP